MLNRSYRFHGYTALSYVHKKGLVVRGRGIALKYAKNTRRDQARVAVVVSKKVSKSAVVRGRIRRRIFEVVRVNHQDIITHPIDMVFSVYDESFADMPSAEVQSAVARLVDRVNL